MEPFLRGLQGGVLSPRGPEVVDIRVFVGQTWSQGRCQRVRCENCVERAHSEPRRPILRSFRGHVLVLPGCGIHAKVWQLVLGPKGGEFCSWWWLCSLRAGIPGPVSVSGPEANVNERQSAPAALTECIGSVAQGFCTVTDAKRSLRDDAVTSFVYAVPWQRKTVRNKSLTSFVESLR